MPIVIDVEQRFVVLPLSKELEEKAEAAAEIALLECEAKALRRAQRQS